MKRRMWLFLFMVACVIATFGWLYFLTWLAWETISTMFA